MTATWSCTYCETVNAGDRASCISCATTRAVAIVPAPKPVEPPKPAILKKSGGADRGVVPPKPVERPAAVSSPRRPAGSHSGVMIGVAAAAVLVVLVAIGLQIRSSSEPESSTFSASPAEASESFVPAASGSSGTSRTTVSRAGRTSTTEAVAESSGAWIAQLASVSFNDGEGRRDEILAGVRGSVPGADWLISDDFASLRPGYWVVYYDGGFTGGAEVLDYCAARGMYDKNQCIGRFLSHDSADFNRMCFRSDDGTMTDACAA